MDGTETLTVDVRIEESGLRDPRTKKERDEGEEVPVVEIKYGPGLGRK